VDHCSIYLGSFDNPHRFEDIAGASPTEREFDRATAQGKGTYYILGKGATKGRKVTCDRKVSSFVRGCSVELLNQLSRGLECTRENHLEATFLRS
jgi:hypothetical protein